MNILLYRKTFFSKETFKVFYSSLILALGHCALLLGIGDVLFPGVFSLGRYGLEVIGGISLLWGMIRIWPRLNISRQMETPDVKISVKVGDLFEQKDNLVIGFSDTFDTEKGQIISPNSIQGQYLTRVYADDRTKLDSDLKSALKGKKAQLEKNKSSGKNKRYPIGTVTTLSNGSNKYFCVAYSFMGNNLQAQSNVSRLTTSLNNLWEEIRIKGECKAISMGVLGSDLARMGHVASHSDLIKLIISSFILTSRENIITKELTVVVKENNLNKLNMLELNEFLQKI